MTTTRPRMAPPMPATPAEQSITGSETSRPQPQAVIDPQVAALAALLRIEADVRRTPTEAALAHLIANEIRGLVRARQAFVARKVSARSFKVQTASSLATVDRNSPLIQWVERLLRGLALAQGTTGIVEFVLPAYADATDSMTTTYPFPNLLWVPLKARDGATDDGVLLARESPWLDADRRIAARLAETCGHALALHRSRPRRLAQRPPIGLAASMIVLALALTGLIPVPMTALAPLEVMARNPQTVTMPVEGIVQEVLVEPNATVVPGQRLVQLVDTIQRNKLELAEREVQVAEAKLEKASSLAFSDARGRHELGIARAELALRKADRNFARTLLDKTSIVAAKAGIAVFSDRKEFEGKPLAVGEKVMLIADPKAVELKIDLAVADSVVLAPGTRAKAFLDSDPLHPIEATVVRIDYQARLSETGVAAYHMVADLQGGEPPQLGVRGTAQLYGPSAPLAVFLLRRPLSAFRQWVGL